MEFGQILGAQIDVGSSWCCRNPRFPFGELSGRWGWCWQNCRTARGILRSAQCWIAAGSCSGAPGCPSGSLLCVPSCEDQEAHQDQVPHARLQLGGAETQPDQRHGVQRDRRRAHPRGTAAAALQPPALQPPALQLPPLQLQPCSSDLGRGIIPGPGRAVILAEGSLQVLGAPMDAG